MADQVAALPRAAIGNRRVYVPMSLGWMAFVRAIGLVTLAGVAHYYIFNLITGDASQALGLLRARMWGIGAEEPHRDALAPGDLALVYLAAPERKFVACAELASAVHDWTASENQVWPGALGGGVLLAHVEEWDPPVPMDMVLSQIDRSAGARADFEVGVVRITAVEYETAVAVAAQRTTSTD